MKSLLVKIASVAVMFHMTFGCSMHHGFGMNACAHQHETACDHDHESHSHDAVHEHHEHHGHDQLPDSDPAGDVGEESHSPCHAGCCDDGCNYLQIVKFEIESLDFSVAHFDTANVLALIECQNNLGFNCDPFPDYSFSDTGMRAHLLFGVQIL